MGLMRLLRRSMQQRHAGLFSQSTLRSGAAPIETPLAMSEPSQWRDRNSATGRPAWFGVAHSNQPPLRGEPNREASTIAKRCVIVTPVRHSMPLTWNVASALGMEFERHDRSSRWQRRSSVPKLLKRPPRPYPCTKVTMTAVYVGIGRPAASWRPDGDRPPCDACKNKLSEPTLRNQSRRQPRNPTSRHEFVVLNPPAGGDRHSPRWRGSAPQRGRADPFWRPSRRTPHRQAPATGLTRSSPSSHP